MLTIILLIVIIFMLDSISDRLTLMRKMYDEIRTELKRLKQ